MKKRVKQYSDDVKKNAVNAVLKSGMGVLKTAKKFKVGRSTLSKWVSAEVRARVKRQGIINVKPKRMLATLPEKEQWQHPNEDRFLHQWKDQASDIVPVLETSMRQVFDPINKPAHYADSKIEVIDYIEDKKLNYHLGNVIKYVSRAGRKTPDALPDLKKARWYLNREISNLEK